MNIVPLRNIIHDDNLASLEEAFSNFKTIDEDKDVEDFLINKAIHSDKLDTSKTYLIFDDLNNLKGYFTLALKVLDVKKCSNNFKKDKLKNKNIEETTAYLIAQVGRDKNYSTKGFGKKMIKHAIGILNGIKKQIGGKIIYIECKDELKEYYNNLNFTYLQKNPYDKSLNQLYIY